MAMVVESCPVTQIGEAAGMVWNALSDDGALSVTKIVKRVELPRDVVLQALGWLAREDKLNIEETSRGKIISLR